MWGEIDQNVLGGAAAAAIHHHLSRYGDLTGDIQAIMTEWSEPLRSRDLYKVSSKWPGRVYTGCPIWGKPGHKSSLNQEELYFSCSRMFLKHIPLSPMLFFRSYPLIYLSIYPKSNFPSLNVWCNFPAPVAKIGTAGHTLLCEIVSLLVHDGSNSGKNPTQARARYFRRSIMLFNIFFLSSRG